MAQLSKVNKMRILKFSIAKDNYAIYEAGRGFKAYFLNPICMTLLGKFDSLNQAKQACDEFTAVGADRW